MVLLIIVTGLFAIPGVSAMEYVLNASPDSNFAGGIEYNGNDPLTITLNDNVTIASFSAAGIESAGPVTIRSPSEKTLTILVTNNSDMLYGVWGSSVTLESGRLDIVIRGSNSPKSGASYALYAGSGNVTVSGGTVNASVMTTAHKNKGIYAKQYVIVSGGSIISHESGGSNTFGLDGGDVDAGNAQGGIVITGGYIDVHSKNASTRNFGIDSKSGTVKISGNPVVFIESDTSGKAENFAYNATITTISGGNAVVFTSTGGNYTLMSSAVFAQNAALLPGKTFEIPAGSSLGISSGLTLTLPAGSTILTGANFGTLDATGSAPDSTGAVLYTGIAPATTKAPVPVGVIVVAVITGLCVAIGAGQKK
ncbi:MAG: hypothetical protein WC342_05585 [Methanoregula sp.]|jgi:hypothetical protein